jgi:phenylalanyl-tRNA synthetase beta chain
MKISKNWLQRYLPEIKNVDDSTIAVSLTQSLAEVEGYEIVGGELKDLVVGRIEELEKHPDADKLRVAKVDTGDRIRTIVCGAPNINKGDHVIVCLPGGSVINPETGEAHEINQSKIRGVESEGMICSEKELGISNDHSGVIILPASRRPGEEIDDEIKDTVFEIENKSLTHRGDCFSHQGIAREIGAILNMTFLPQTFDTEVLQTESLPLEVEVQTAKAERFSALTIKGVKIGPSPLWLKIALSRIGVATINNVVDITNYVMFDLGQPLHAYDYRKISQNKLIVREAKSGEKMEAINGKEYELMEGDIVITDGKSIQDIAGIMGAKDSEISESTEDVILEAAIFNNTQILQTSRRLGLVSDASIRMSKHPDMSRNTDVLTRAAELIVELTEGEIASETLVINSVEPELKVLEFDIQDLARKIGKDIPLEDSITILQKLGIEVDRHNLQAENRNLIGVPQVVKLTIPSWRQDINIAEDIVEEVARVYGYNLIEPRLPTRDLSATDLTSLQKLIRSARRRAIELGFSEVYTYSFISEDFKQTFELEERKLIEIKNAISPELKYVRNSLAPSLVEAYQKNLNWGKLANLKLMEISQIADNYDYYENNNANMPRQDWQMGLLTASTEEQSVENMLSLKGYIQETLKTLGAEDNELNWAEFEESVHYHVNNFLHPARRASLKLNGEVIAWLGEINPLISRKLNVKERLCLAQLNLSKLDQLLVKREKSYKQISNLPIVRRDVTISMNSKYKVGDVLTELRSELNAAVDKFTTDSTNTVTANVEYVTSFAKDDSNSLTFALSLTPYEQTLKREEVNSIIDQALAPVLKKFQAEVK